MAPVPDDFVSCLEEEEALDSESMFLGRGLTHRAEWKGRGRPSRMSHSVGRNLLPVACCSRQCENQSTSDPSSDNAVWGPRGGGVRSLSLVRASPPEWSLWTSAWYLRLGLPFSQHTPSS